MNKCTAKSTNPVPIVALALPRDVACRLYARLQNDLTLDTRVTRGTGLRRGSQRPADDRVVCAAIKAAVTEPTPEAVCEQCGNAPAVICYDCASEGATGNPAAMYADARYDRD